MRALLFSLFFLLVFVILPDIYLFKRIKNKVLRIVHWFPALFFAFYIVAMRYTWFEKYAVFEQNMPWALWLFLLVYIPKFNYVLFSLLGSWYNKLFKRKTKVFKYTGLLIALINAFGLLYGTFITRHNYEVKQVTILSPALPASFDGYKIVQLSDFHLGDFMNNYREMDKIARLVNAQKADIIVFTGDLVSHKADETEGWEAYFNMLAATDGKFAVLGNHDYGDHYFWKNEEEKQANFSATKAAFGKLGFQLLLDEWKPLIRETDTIALIGIENWGKAPFPQYGNLDNAKIGTEHFPFNILLSHDPTSWRELVAGKENIQLTLSGHTHGFQMGYNNEKIKFSPSQLIFKEWTGLHEENGQYLYVNVGIGTIGIPFRIGIRPEITVITMNKSEE